MCKLSLHNLKQNLPYLYLLTNELATHVKNQIILTIPYNRYEIPVNCYSIPMNPIHCVLEPYNLKLTSHWEYPSTYVATEAQSLPGANFRP